MYQLNAGTPNPEQIDELYTALGRYIKEQNHKDPKFKTNESQTSKILAENFINKLEHKSIAEENKLLKSGYHNIDTLINGFKKGGISIIASRTGHGKTSLMLNLVKSMLDENRILFVNLEDSAESSFTRLQSIETKIDTTSIISGGITENEKATLKKAVQRYENANLWFHYMINSDLYLLLEKLRYYKEAHHINVVFIDSIQLLSCGYNERFTRDRELAKVVTELKMLARELDIAIVASSQISREMERRGGSKRPMLSDLRESGSLEEASDLIGFLYVPYKLGLEVLEDGTPTNNIAQLIIAKNRNGYTGEINLHMNLRTGEFEDLSGNFIDDFIDKPRILSLDDEMYNAPF